MAEPVPHRPGFVPGAIRRAFHHVRRDHRYFCVVLGRPGRGVRRQTDDVRRARALPAGYLRLRRSVAARTALPADARDLCPARVRLSAVRLFFLVWIAYAAPKNGLGKAVGWFWFVFTGGLNVLGAYYSSWAIERIGNINTLWTSVFWALLGRFSPW